jgi:AAA domain
MKNDEGAAGKAAAVELYATDRYFALTNKPLAGTPLHLADGSDAVQRLVAWADGMARAKVGPDAEAPKERGPRKETAFTFVNDQGLKNLPAWVPELFPEAVPQGSTGGYRVSSAALGRDLEEGLGITPQGITDWGLADQPGEEERQGKRTPIDLVIEHGGAPNARAAAEWLAERLGITDEFQARLQGQSRAEDDFAGFFPGGAETGKTESGAADEEVPRPTAKDRLKSLIIQAACWKNKAVPERPWLWKNWVPRRVVSSCYGDGGLGKTILGQQACTAVAAGRPWLGVPLEIDRRPAFGMFCEDEENEGQRRQVGINAAVGVDYDDLEHAHFLFDKEQKVILGQLNQQTKLVEPTPLFQVLESILDDIGPGLIVLDPLAMLFRGDWMSTDDAFDFVGLFKRWAKKYDAGVLLLAHPSKAGMASGRGDFSSVGWSAAVRSRLYLDKRKDGKGKEIKGERTLTNMKANYAPDGNTIHLRWDNWGFVPIDVGSSTERADKIDGAILSAMVAIRDRGVAMSANTGVSNGYPKLIGKEPGMGIYDEKEIIEAVNRLAALELVEFVTEKTKRRVFA